MLEVGTKVKDFTLLNQYNWEMSLSDFLGRKVVLFFYTRNNALGCTKEALGFAKNYEWFRKINAAVIGISPDTVSSHEKFIKKNSLPFLLCSDPEHKIIDEFGLWKKVEKNEIVTYKTAQITFIIDETGVIEKIIPVTKPETHAVEILNYFKETLTRIP